MEIRVVCQVATNGCVVAEDLVFHYMLARHHRTEEVGNVGSGVVIALRKREGLRIARRRKRLRMCRLPLFHSLLALRGRHPAPAIRFELRPHILRGKRDRLARQYHRSLRTVKLDSFIAVTVGLVAMQMYLHSSVL